MGGFKSAERCWLEFRGGLDELLGDGVPYAMVVAQ
ncbi:hypothetical protein A2U01_0082391 [Trifolium medium]|uniref:Uncharacterized protein n=1 Tax=Trifolium medium TaxID=97028 RepID=A0A392TMK9_9FABA|nr:hypothetical protein [Trifolium medium]